MDNESVSPDSSARLHVDVRFSLGVRHLSLRLSSNASSLAVVGPSGAGKSTLLRIIAGVDRSARGTVALGGRCWLDTDSGIWVPPWLRSVGWVPQDGLLFPHQDVLNNLRYGTAGDDGVLEVARLLRIDHLLRRMPNRLSGGERQRVALGRALLAASDLLLLDEPFSALDRPLRAEIRDVVREWSTRHDVVMVLVTHDDEDAEVLAEEAYALSAGALTRR